METIGTWIGNGPVPAFEQADLLAVVSQLRRPTHVVQDVATGALGVAHGGELMPPSLQAPGGAPAWPLIATLTSCRHSVHSILPDSSNWLIMQKKQTSKIWGYAA